MSLEEETPSPADAELRALLESAPVLLCALARDGTIRRLSPHWERAFGHSPRRLLGRSLLQLVHPDDRSAVQARFSKFGVDGPAHFECRLRHRSGIYRRLRWDGRLDADGERLLLVAHDITDDQRAKHALRNEHRLWRSLIECSPDIILMLDRNANIVYMNRTITGRSVDEIIGTSLYHHVPTGFHPTLEVSLRRALETRQNDRCSFEYQRSANDPSAVLELRINPILRDGEVSAMAINMTDITVSRRALEDLERSRSRLKAFLSALDDLALEISLDGVILNLWTRDPTELLLPSETFPGSLLEEAFPKKIADKLLATTAELAESADFRQKTFDYNIPTGDTQRVFSARLTLINPGGAGRPASVACLVRDVTEREALVGQLETRAADLQEFAHAAWHDLKNPLTTVRNFVGVIGRDVEKGRLDRVPRDLERMRASIDQMTELLEGFWTMSRVDRLLDNPQPVAMLEVLRDTIDLVSQPVGRRQVHVKIAVDLPDLRADPVLLRYLLQHLVDNAIKFMNEDVQPEVEISSRRSEGERIFYVRDNGIGVDMRYKEKIFGLFQQLDPRSSGTGIGLALAKRIVEGYGGRIWVESTGPGEGSTFYFTLPRTLVGPS